MEDEMSRASSMHGIDEKCIQNCTWKYEQTRTLGRHGPKQRWKDIKVGKI
jgi:hypothetical protein